MATGEAPDPVRATFVAILQQLNRAESRYEGQSREQALYLDDLERALRKFWAVDEQRVKLPLALGLLVRNGLVKAEVGSGGPPRGPARGRPSYRITSEGKQFLVEALEKADRIP
jgi:DNA-binding PadR family transcriptional regulator